MKAKLFLADEAIAQGALDAGPEPAVREHALGDEGRQDGVAKVGVARSDLFHGEVVGEVAGAHDLDPVVEHEQADGGADQIVPVNQGIDQKLLKNEGNFLLIISYYTIIPQIRIGYYKFFFRKKGFNL